MKEEGGLGSA